MAIVLIKTEAIADPADFEADAAAAPQNNAHKTHVMP